MKYNIIAQIEARAKEGKKNESGSKFEPKMKLKMHTVITHKMSHKFGSESPEEKHNNLVLSTLFTMSKRKRRIQLLRSI